MADADATAQHPETVASIARLYLGNLLFAIERCAVSLEADGRPLDAAFYRGIGRSLAEAHGREREREQVGPAGR